MKVLIVSEGKHELGGGASEGALAILVSRLLSVPARCSCEKISSSKVRIHRRPGKGGSLCLRALAWCRYARQENFDAVIVLLDQDGDGSRLPEIDTAQRRPTPAVPRAMGVAVRSFDAWMLADEKALTQVLEKPVQRQPDPETIRDPKQACVKLRDSSGCGLSTTDLYAALARRIDVDQLRERCPNGFATFADRVRKLAAFDRASQN